MTLKIYEELEQGSPEWLAARCGILTASVVGQMITPKTVKAAANDTARSLANTLIAERITGHVEPIQPSRAMERGTLDEPYAREHYSKNYAPAVEVGFMVRTINGHKLGYSPDGLVGDDGLIEIKSRNQRIQLQTVLEDAAPIGNMAQMQAGMLVSGRKWCDYVSFCSGMPLYVKRVFPDERWFAAITDALYAFETTAEDIISRYLTATANMPPTERLDHFLDDEMEF